MGIILLATSKDLSALAVTGPLAFQSKPKEKSFADTRSEAVLEQRLIQAVRNAKGLIIKLPALWYIGIPDRMILLPEARIFFVELKIKSKRARGGQAAWIRKLRALGFRAGTVRGSEALEKFIQTYLGGVK